MSEKITILVVEPQQAPYTKLIENSLKALQNEVNGYIQAIYPYDDSVALICNEEGIIHSLPLNRAIRNDSGEIIEVIAGTFLIAGLGKDEFASLTQEQLTNYKELFLQPEQFYLVDQKIHAVPINLRKFDIYQLNDDPKSAVPQLMEFMNYDYHQRSYFPIESTNYKLMYSGTMADDETLDNIYLRFNINIPNDFRGHSLSVSDVVVVTDDGKRTAYFVDSIGFKEIPDFFTREETNITNETVDQKIRGISGTWNTIDQTEVDGTAFFLMRSEDHPQADGEIIVDAHGGLILQHIINGFDDPVTELLKMEIMPVEKMPDIGTSIQQMKNYGYFWGGMLPLTPKRAIDLFNYLPVYHLKQNDTEGLITEESEIYQLAGSGCIFGVEKADWNKLWESSNDNQRKVLFSDKIYGTVQKI